MNPRIEQALKFGVGSAVTTMFTANPPAKPLTTITCIAALAVAVFVPSFLQELRGTGRNKPLRIGYVLIASVLSNYTVAGVSFLSGMPMAYAIHFAAAFSSAILILGLGVLLDRKPPEGGPKRKKTFSLERMRKFLLNKQEVRRMVAVKAD